MQKLVILAIVLLFVTPAFAQQTLNYSWEDGGTILGFYGNLCCDTNVSGVQNGFAGDGVAYSCPGAVDGTQYLHIAEDPHYGTPEAYVAWVTGLTDGDVVTAGFYGYDVSPGLSPSMRIWGSYTSVGGDINSYAGSAGGNVAYTAGNGWDFVDWSWTFDSDLGSRDGLRVAVRLYSYPTTSDPNHTDYWIDDLTVTAPDHAVIHFPEPMSPVEESTWGTIKAMYR